MLNKINQLRGHRLFYNTYSLNNKKMNGALRKELKTENLLPFIKNYYD